MKEIMIVTEPFKLLAITTISAKQQVNNHGTIEVTGIIHSGNKEEYLQQAAKESWIKVSTIDENGEIIPFFQGVLDKLVIRTSGEGCVLSFSASTGTRLMDIDYHTRSFQNKGITYRDVIDTCNENYPQSATIMTAGKGNNLPHFYMQYRESDWDFIKRLASSLHTIVVPSCKTQGVKYFFGVPEKRQDAVFETDEYQIEQNWSEYMQKKENKAASNAAEEVCYVTQSREIYDLGDGVLFQGKRLCIWKIETKLKGSELVHTYYLKSKNGLRTIKTYNEKLIGLTLLGRTDRVEGETIQMSIKADENVKNTGYRWFQYSTVYSSEDGTGWYCMPEIGDTVRLYFPTEDETEAYSSSAVHEKQGGGIRTDPDQKIWRNKEGKEIRLAPDRVLITNNDGLSVELNDKKGVSINSDKSIYVNASDRVNISSMNGSLEMSASNRISLKQGDTKLELADGINLEGARVKLE